MMITVGMLSERLGLDCLEGSGGLDGKVSGCYIGDLLSWVMGRAQEGSAWITVMGNVNAVAVAALADVACMILCDNAPLDEDAKTKAAQNGITVLRTELDAFSLAAGISRLLDDAG